LTISVIIPTLKDPRLDTCLNNLEEQNGRFEVVVADYDPEYVGIIRRIASDHGARYVRVYKKGIGYARHIGVTHSTGRCIVNFDADTMFEDDDGLMKVAAPILRGEAILAFCDVEYDISSAEGQGLRNVELIQLGADFDMLQQRLTGFCVHERGTAMNRQAYFSVGGFKDTPTSEQANLSLRLFLKYGFATKHVNTRVITSSRRIHAMFRHGPEALDYEKFGYR
jgi:glycosyltransferase involved in cell wall biosynthesis